MVSYGNNTVSAVSPSGTVSTFVSTGLNQPESLAFDSSGNLYIANTGDDTVSKVVNGNVSTFASGFGAAPSGLAFDQSGNLYVAIGAHDTISKVTPQGSISDFVAPGPSAPDGLGDPSGLAFDSAGNLYVSNFGGFGGNTISEVTPGGTVSTFVADDAGLNGPEALAFDAAGNLYVSNFAGTTVSEVTPAGTVSTFASGFNEPLGLAFAPSSGDGQDGGVSITVPVQGGVTGNLFVSNFSASTDTVSEVSTTVTVPFTLGGTATAGTDYNGVTASPLVFPLGQTTEDITGALLADPGPSQTITFTLSTPSSNAALGSPNANTLTINEPNSAPTLTSISPNSATAGDSDATITLIGTGYVNGSMAAFNGNALVTTFDSATQLTAVIPAADLATVGQDQITVTTAGPGGGTSSPQTFTVNNPTLSLPPDLAISLTDNLVNHTVDVGQAVIFTATISNSGGPEVAPITVNVNLPAGLTSVTVGDKDQTGDSDAGNGWTTPSVITNQDGSESITAFFDPSGEDGPLFSNQSVELLVSGNLTAAAASPFTVNVRYQFQAPQGPNGSGLGSIGGTTGPNGGPPTGMASDSITVNPALTITPPPLPEATAGANYTQTITAAGGTKPYTTFAVNNFSAGTTGLTAGEIVANAQTGLVAINGTPTGAGTATFTINVADSAGAVMGQPYSITVDAVPTSPGNGLGSNGGIVPFGAATDIPVPADYDGTGENDLAVYDPSTAVWDILRANNSSQQIQFGFPGDIPVPADYDGTGMDQLAVYHPSTGTYFILHADGTVSATSLGAPGDIPVPADYDGMGKDQLAVYRPSTAQWFILGTKNRLVQFGAPGDIPVPADYDGTGESDFAVYRPSTGQWFILHVDGTRQTIGFGAPGDIPVPADYDGSGKDQLAVYRPSSEEWFVNSANGPTAINFGFPGQVPLLYHPSTGVYLVNGPSGLTPTVNVTGDLLVPGSYDGVGQADFAFYHRPSQGAAEFFIAPPLLRYHNPVLTIPGGPGDRIDVTITDARTGTGFYTVNGKDPIGPIDFTGVTALNVSGFGRVNIFVNNQFIKGSFEQSGVTLTIGDPVVVALTGVGAIFINDAAAVNAIAGPDTADRAASVVGLSANEQFVQTLYLDELGRPGALSELDGWAAAFSQPGFTQEAAQAAIAVGIEHSPEARDHLVKAWYLNFLGRPALGGEEQGWVSLLLAGQSEEQVLSRILGSQEFHNDAQTLISTGTAQQRYFQALYQVLLNRTGETNGAAGWVSELPQLGEAGVALGFLRSSEFRSDDFEAYYNALLHRPDDLTGLNDWVFANLDMGAVRIGFEASPEFYTNG